jgi:putative transposase
MSNSKHTPEFRAKAAQEYLDGYDSIQNLANKYHVGYTTLREWINQYQIHGISAFITGNGNKKYSKKKKKYKSVAPNETAENKLDRDFYASAPNEKWATDVTEFKISGTQKKLYLSAILDLYDRYPVSHILSCRNNNNLVFKTFDKAIAANPDAKPLFHSDRGFQVRQEVA